VSNSSPGNAPGTTTDRDRATASKTNGNEPTTSSKAQPVAENSSAPGKNDPHGPAEKPADAAQPPAEPATPEEAAKVLDLRTFARMEGADPTSSATIAHLHYVIPSTIDKAFAYHRDQLLETGWIELPNKFTNDEVATASFARDGFKVTLTVTQMEKSGGAGVTIDNHGNVDTAHIPVPPNAQRMFNTPVATGYATRGAAEKVHEAIRELLTAQGWEPYGAAGDSKYYKKNGVRLGARVVVMASQGGRTMIDYSTEQLSTDIPAPEDAEQVQYSDLTSHLSFQSPGGADEIVNFYRESLGKRGWKASSEKPVKVNTKQILIFLNEEQDLIELSMAPTGDRTQVDLRHRSEQQIAESQGKSKS
jgi:hypothetical protein